MERIFTHYHPRQVAKFVKTLFCGSFIIKGIGVFFFEKGKVMLPDLNNREMLSIMKEVNQTIDSLTLAAS